MRRYNNWAGNPHGTPENPELCVVQVHQGGRSGLYTQCYEKRGKGPDGLYCTRHAKALDAGKPMSVPEDRPPLRIVQIGGIHDPLIVSWYEGESQTSWDRAYRTQRTLDEVRQLVDKALTRAKNEVTRIEIVAARLRDMGET